MMLHTILYSTGSFVSLNFISFVKAANQKTEKYTEKRAHQPIQTLVQFFADDVDALEQHFHKMDQISVLYVQYTLYSVREYVGSLQLPFVLHLHIQMVHVEYIVLVDGQHIKYTHVLYKLMPAGV